MIKKFQKDFGQNYYNAVQLVYLFIVSEIMEILSYLGIYSPSQESYSYRRAFWLIIASLFFGSVFILFVATSSIYLLKSFNII